MAAAPPAFLDYLAMLNLVPIILSPSNTLPSLAKHAVYRLSFLQNVLQRVQRLLSVVFTEESQMLQIVPAHVTLF